MKKRGLHPSFFMLVWNYQMKENYIMAYVTYKNRSSSAYRFTCETLQDPAISELRQQIKGKGYLRIRPRGPRKGNAAGLWGVYYDTPIANATHFDVYVRDYK